MNACVADPAGPTGEASPGLGGSIINHQFNTRMNHGDASRHTSGENIELFGRDMIEHCYICVKVLGEDLFRHMRKPISDLECGFIAEVAVVENLQIKELYLEDFLFKRFALTRRNSDPFPPTP